MEGEGERGGKVGCKREAGGKDKIDEDLLECFLGRAPTDLTSECF